MSPPYTDADRAFDLEQLGSLRDPNRCRECGGKSGKHTKRCIFREDDKGGAMNLEEFAGMIEALRIKGAARDVASMDGVAEQHFHLALASLEQAHRHARLADIAESRCIAAMQLGRHLVTR